MPSWAAAALPSLPSSVAPWRRITGTPYSPVLVPLTRVHTLKAWICSGPFNGLPVQLQVTLGMPLVSVGLLRALSRRWGPRPHPRWRTSTPDEVVAQKIGRTAQAVRGMRTRRGIPNPAARPGAYGSPPWTAAEDRLVRTLPPAQAAARTGRTMDAVYRRRHHLGLTGHRRTVAKSRRR